MSHAIGAALSLAALLPAAALAAAPVPPLAQPGRGAAAAQRGATGYWPSSTCGGCHPRTLGQQIESHHEASFTNPIFQAQYFEMVLPRASREPALAAEARSCAACHAPVAFGASRSATREASTDPSMSGVTCDLCHTIRGIDGQEPLNGNFLSSPSEVKFGPLKGADNAHHAFSPIQSKSELCGTCHEATNHHGLRVKSTFTEWAQSPSAKGGIQCQDCHMTRDGLVRAAAIGSEGFVRYTHRFPGAHSRSQVEGAIRLGIEPATAAGRRLAFQVTVDNRKSGHRMPTGSTDLRLLWLDVTARAGDQVLAVPVSGGGLGVAGQARDDARLVGKDVPAGSRIYRALFLDAAGKQTLQSWDAVRISFDNRLPAGEVVSELYTLDLPREVRGPVKVEARLRYLAYPSSFAALMDLPATPPVDVATAAAELTVP
ncbi:MAG TPA: multiheme c-type cytochrome [Anaeromyxobacteraceae bacterium]|nr:multiheme c-type cytochrome [Anaeromyxobacteraceae bacterium]